MSLERQLVKNIFFPPLLSSGFLCAMIQRNQINSCGISCAAVALAASLSPLIAAEPLPTIELRDAYPALKFDRPLWMEEAPDASKRDRKSTRLNSSH